MIKEPAVLPEGNASPISTFKSKSEFKGFSRVKNRVPEAQNGETLVVIGTCRFHNRVQE